MDLQHIFFGFRKQIATWLKTWKWQSFWRTGHSFSADQMPLETSPLQNLNGPCHYMTSSSDQATTVSCDTQRWTQNLLKAMKKSMFNWIQWNSQSHMRALCRLNQMKNPSLPETLSFPGFESSGKLLLNPKDMLQVNAYCFLSDVWAWLCTGHSFSADQMPLETSPLQNLNGPCHYMTSSSDQATTVSCDTQRWTQNLLKAMKKSMFNWIQWNSQSHMKALCRLNQMKNLHDQVQSSSWSQWRRNQL